MNDLLRIALVIALVLLVPVVPFLVADTFEDDVLDWLDAATNSRTTFAALVVATLSSDIVLPVPSSVVSTLGGAQLGLVWGTTASWLGMTAGATIGFTLARSLGRPLAARLANPRELERIERLNRRFGTAVLVLTRPLPVLAEATVLLVGVSRLSWRRFFTAVALSNLGIAAAYSAFGYLAFEQGALPVAVVASVALPVAATLAVRAIVPTSLAAHSTSSKHSS